MYLRLSSCSPHVLRNVFKHGSSTQFAYQNTPGHKVILVISLHYQGFLLWNIVDRSKLLKVVVVDCCIRLLMCTVVVECCC